MTHLLSNPDLALLLILTGILLLYAEFNRPGTILFACLGTLFATLGVYALAEHSINRPALALALISLALIPAGIRILPLTIIGAAILIYALRILIPENQPIHLTTAIFVSLTFSFVTLWLGRIALQARRNKRLPNPTPHPARRVD